jgi:hypothetical protein
MRLRFHKSLIICGILILYVLIPILDSMVCADCIVNAPFRGKAAIGHLQAPHDDVIYISQGEAESRIPDEQAATSFCSICSNFLTGVEGFASHVYLFVAQTTPVLYPHSPTSTIPSINRLRITSHKLFFRDISTGFLPEPAGISLSEIKLVYISCINMSFYYGFKLSREFEAGQRDLRIDIAKKHISVQERKLFYVCR